MLRSPIGWDEIPADLKDATVAIEDQRFYTNDGVDLTGHIPRRDQGPHQRRRGAGRLDDHDAAHAQPLPRRRPAHAAPEDHRGEAGARLRPKHHDKHSILTSYLNSVPYGTLGGQTAVGVQAAARMFFNKPASQLDLEQSRTARGAAAGAVGIQPVPRPRGGADAAQRGAREDGRTALHHPTRSRADRAAPLEIHHGNFYTARKEDFFFEYVREQLIARYGAKTVEQGGLKVYTTINLNMQRLARKAIAEVLDEPEDPASAIVTIDPEQRGHRGDGRVREL